MTLLQETIKLLQDDPRSSAVIAAGADLGKEWLTKFRKGDIDDPGVMKIEKLRAYLKKSKPKKTAA